MIEPSRLLHRSDVRAARAWTAAAACLGLAAIVALLVGCGAAVLPSVHSDSERLALARKLVNQGRYERAIDLLKTYVSSSSGSAEVDGALYLLGYSYLRTKAWTDAETEFDRVLRDYPESDSAGSAAFRLGEALYGQARPADFDQDFTHKALDQWESYLRGYPGHWLNAEAERKISLARSRLASKLLDTGRLYLKLKLPDPARVYFTKVRDDYGDSILLGDALLGIALCDEKDGDRDMAIQHLKEIEAQYPGQPIAAKAARERQRLVREAGRHRS